MKRPVLIGLLLLLVFAACHTPTREARRMLARAERLADTLPDSTLRLIDSVMRMEAYLSERERMDMALLQGEVLFRDASLDDDDVLDSVATIPELERAASYYAKKKQYAKAAHAALYIGYVQQHYNEKDVAMQSFKEAEHNGRLVDDSLTMASAEYQMGRMLLNNGMNKESINILQDANLCFGNHYSDKSLVYNTIAACYILLGDYDNAEQHLQVSLEYADKGHFTAAKIKAFNNYAVLFRQKGEYDKALAYLRKAESIVDAKGRLIVCLNKATVFMAQGEMDSTSLYLQQVEGALSTVDVKKETQVSAYSTLSQFAESQENYAEAYRYRGLYDHLLFNLMADREQKNIYRIRQQYDYNALKETMDKKLIHRQRIILVISMVAILALVILVISVLRMEKMRKREAEVEADLSHFKQQNEKLQRKHETQRVQQAALSGRLKQSNQTVRELKKRIRQQDDAEKPQKQATTFAEEPICRLIMERVSEGQFKSRVNHLDYKDFALDKTQLHALREAVDSHFNQFTRRLARSYPALSKSDLDYCSLYLLGLTDADIAALIQRSYSTVNERSSKLKCIFECENTLSTTLLNIANETID